MFNLPKFFQFLLGLTLAIPVTSLAARTRVEAVDFRLLDENPSAYTGRKVRVVGYVVGAPGALYLSKIVGGHCHGDPGSRELYLNFSGRYQTKLPNFFRKKVVLEGVFESEKYPKKPRKYDIVTVDDGKTTFGPMKKIIVIRVYQEKCTYPGLESQ